MPTSYPNTRAFSNIARQRDAGDAFAALPVHILITHVLSSGNLPDPSDLARLRAVSREMRDAVAATGHEVYELEAENAIHFGNLGALQPMHQRGDLDDDFNSLCTWAAEEGQLEILKWLRENGAPWNEYTCAWAAHGGDLEMLQWARANGCPLSVHTWAYAVWGGHLEVLQWARANAAANGHSELLSWARANGAPEA